MLRKSLLGLIILMAGVVLVFPGCVDDGDNSIPSDGPGLPGPGVLTGQDSSWPSSGKLSEYVLGGWNQPAGIDGVSWEEKRIGQSGTYYMLYITFTSATTATKNSIDDYLEAWANDSNLIQNDNSIFEGNYTKAADSLRYSVIVSYNLSTGGSINLTRLSESDINPLALITH